MAAVISVDASTIELESSWKKHLIDEFKKPYMQSLKQYLLAQKQAGKVIYPDGDSIFKAFELTPLAQVKVVLIGQDPYHGIGQAHGLCFSVKPGIKPPPSLINIYKELNDDLGVPIANHGFLESWAKQGILMLNSVLTVERGKAGAHQGKGWEQFTDQVIALLNQQKRPLIFVLWGRYAHQKGQYIDTKKHAVLKAAHPSPFSARNGFFGCRHFSKINGFLQDTGQQPIEWALPNA